MNRDSTIRGCYSAGWLFFLLLLTAGLISREVNGQNVQFTASSRQTVSVGEQFRLNFTVNADGRDFKAPSLSDFYVLSGPNPSTSSSIQIINGKVSRSVTLTYGYILQAIKEGVFQVQPATITVDGKQYESNALTINVSAAGGSQPSGPQTPSTPQPRQKEEVGDVGQSDVFIRTSVNKKNPYQGEQVIVSHKIYTRVGISQYGVEKYPSYNGFWTQELQNLQDEPNKHNEAINGQEYLVAEINKVALFPVKNGTLTIEPMELNVVAQVRRSRSRSNDPFADFFNDPFFGSSYQNVQKKIVSNPVTIEVKPLPSANKPADFNGVVGKYTFKSNIDKTSVDVNEAVNLKFTVLGEGNIRLIDELNVAFPPDFEVYDPKTSFNLNKNSQGISGVKTFEYLMIPRNSGNFRIKPVAFSYFDPEQAAYVSQSSPLFEINVRKGASPSSPDISYSGVVQQDVQYIGTDIRHIKNNPVILTVAGKTLFGSITHILLIIIPLLLAIFLTLLIQQQLRKRSNVHWMKTQKATKVARTRLKKASEYLKSLQEKEFYNEVSQALWGYISDKFNLPLVDLSMDSVHETLKNKNIKDTIIEQFIETLNHCEYARFAPGEKSENMDKIYEEALNVISKTERELK